MYHVVISERLCSEGLKEVGKTAGDTFYYALFACYLQIKAQN